MAAEWIKKPKHRVPPKNVLCICGSISGSKWLQINVEVKLKLKSHFSLGHHVWWHHPLHLCQSLCLLWATIGSEPTRSQQQIEGLGITRPECKQLQMIGMNLIDFFFLMFTLNQFCADLGQKVCRLVIYRLTEHGLWIQKLHLQQYECWCIVTANQPAFLHL